MLFMFWNYTAQRSITQMSISGRNTNLFNLCGKNDTIGLQAKATAALAD